MTKTITVLKFRLGLRILVTIVINYLKFREIIQRYIGKVFFELTFETFIVFKLFGKKLKNCAPIF